MQSSTTWRASEANRDPAARSTDSVSPLHPQRRLHRRSRAEPSHRSLFQEPTDEAHGADAERDRRHPTVTIHRQEYRRTDAGNRYGEAEPRAVSRTEAPCAVSSHAMR